MDKQINTVEAIEKVLPYKLKTFRQNMGLTTAQVAKMLNKTPSAITLWETGKSLPDVYALLKLCEIYQVSDLNEFLDTTPSLNIKTLSRSERELIKLWRTNSNSIKASIKTILKNCAK